MTNLNENIDMVYLGPVDQWLDYLAHNQQVVGSSPAGSTVGLI